MIPQPPAKSVRPGRAPAKIRASADGGWMSEKYPLHAEEEECFILTSPFIEPDGLVTASRIRRRCKVMDRAAQQIIVRKVTRGLVQLGCSSGAGPDIIVGRARTRGLSQRELSKRLSPPAKCLYLKLVTWGGIISYSVFAPYQEF
jgi:hypothetical protein